MPHSDRKFVTDKRGVTGTLTTRVVEPNNVAVDAEGTTYLVPRKALTADGETGYRVGFSFEGLPTVPIHPAHLLNMHAIPGDMNMDLPPVQPDLASPPFTDLDRMVEVEDVEIERVPMDEILDTAPEVRQEGDVTIIPVVEEFLVVQRKLRLKEEIRVTKTRRSVPGRSSAFVEEPANRAHLA
ncbi:DUF2382 domain-containing protein [Fimbriimonas ginsengisoli]|uniref:DUF2382 domain-containing protein n=1 Tax=Fimbriimonas ginsengisoli Gsoil 348 TaxID=661478 RepID=A0A068NRA1_FIMGI|nr:DUF2382 domain-containing protein [Fimbriimonas ginsengisoli]AIE84109.1 hypothetical protein OP10G_0741 [Fimbriimonas ginsengisoli Gsoil 348]